MTTPSADGYPGLSIATRSTRRDVDDIYPLAPLQQGLLFHSLNDPDGDVYVVQLVVSLQAALDATRLRDAWRRVVAAHPALRTGIEWSQFDRPLQVVHRDVDLPFEELDWTSLPASQQRRRRAELLAADRRRGFELKTPPLLRIALLRLSEQCCEMVVTYHHVILDGWSTARMLDEVITVYTGQGRPRPTAPYRSFIEWVATRDAARGEAFWRRELAGLTTPTRLPVRARPGDAPPSRGSRRVVLPPHQTGALERLARLYGVTVSTVLAGATVLLAGRYSGEQDAVIGVTVAGRPPQLRDADAMIGLFINTLPLRARLDLTCSVAEWLSQLQERIQAVQDHDYCALPDVQRWSELAPDEALFDTIFVFENYPVRASHPDAQLQAHVVAVHEHTDYPLTITVVPGPGLTLEFSYQGDFDPGFVDQLVHSYQTLVAQLVSHPDEALCAIEVLDDDERRVVLRDWNASAVDLPETTVVELLERQAERAPSRPAVVEGERCLTYGELERRSNRLARRLRTLGVSCEDVVALCAEPSIEMVVGLVGILKSGGAYFPLDPDHPDKWLRGMVRHCGVRWAVTYGGRARRVLALVERGGVALDRDEALLAACDPSRPPAAATPRNLAYVLSTSGSTGDPKVVAIEHRNAAGFLQWASRSFGEPMTRVAALASLSFDLSVFECLGPLVAGGTVFVASDRLDVAAQLEAARPTLLNGVPSVLRRIAEERRVPSSVVAVTVAGEPLDRALVDLLYAAPGVDTVSNLYGPTETTTYSTGTVVTRSDDGPPTIGRPLSNTQVYLLDAALRPVPPGVEGEIYIGGRGVARGYLARPDLTAASFVPDPFGAPGARLYRTGDFARYLPDGDIQFVGRRDAQVKVRGLRIELGQIEAVLAEHPAVEQAAVVAGAGPRGTTRLIAYVVTGAAVTAPELESHLSQALPAHMVPTAYVELEAMPLTRTLKIDRAALPPPPAPSRDDYVAPATRAEETLAAIWAEVMGLERVGVRDNFLELGGDSIVAIQVSARAHRAGLPVTPRQVLAHRTVEELAAACGKAPPAC